MASGATPMPTGDVVCHQPSHSQCLSIDVRSNNRCSDHLVCTCLEGRRVSCGARGTAHCWLARSYVRQTGCTTPPGRTNKQHNTAPSGDSSNIENGLDIYIKLSSYRETIYVRQNLYKTNMHKINHHQLPSFCLASPNLSQHSARLTGSKHLLQGGLLARGDRQFIVTLDLDPGSGVVAVDLLQRGLPVLGGA